MIQGFFDALTTHDRMVIIGVLGVIIGALAVFLFITVTMIVGHYRRKRRREQFENAERYFRKPFALAKKGGSK